MKNEAVTFAVLALLLALTAAALILKVAYFFTRFNRCTRRIAEKIERADDGAEYLRLRKELYCHYLGLIPFIKDRNVGRIYNRLFRKSSLRQTAPRKDALGHLLTPSLIGTVACAFCLCGVSWAWFTSTQSHEIAVVQMAKFTVEVAVDEITLTPEQYAAYTLSDGAHTVKIKSNGTAQTGYCNVKIGETEYYTEQISNGAALEFEITVSESTAIKITPQWGTCTRSDVENKLPPSSTP